MDAKLKAKAMTDDQLDGVAGGRIVMGRGVGKEGRFQLSTWEEVENETCRDIDDFFNSKYEGVYHKGTKNKQPTLNTYSLKFL